jgi:thiol-disulfide isomerase/thioredoxin
MARIRAPELVGRGWVGVESLSLAELRGRFALIDFWTFCCINCLHVLDELRPLEERWGDVVTVVGVHSPKFSHEADPDALADAIVRYEVTHPVLDDADMTTWQAYAARAWPTLVLVDPEGFIVARYAGEGHVHAIDALLSELVPQAERRGLLRAGGGPALAPVPESDGLLFPSAVLGLSDGRWLVSDTAHHQLAVLDADAERIVARIGTGVRGHRDGGPSEAQLNEPAGLCLLPPQVARAVGYDVVVADSVNHALRGLTLDDGQLRTVAGTGRAWTPTDPSSLSSPRDVAWWDERVWVAMAGIHQIWSFDPVTGTAAPVAGTRTEGLRDGPLDEAWFAQPSGLAPDSDRLWLVDAETSALRYVRDGAVHTVVGSGLFDFGFRDGGRDRARLQHPLGVIVLPDATIGVCDTFNGALRVFDPAAGELTTAAAGLREPSGAALDGGAVLVVESAAHRLVTVPLDARARASGTAERSERPPTPIAGGHVSLQVVFAAPAGQRLDERYGPPTRLTVSATPAALLRSGDGAGTQMRRSLDVDASVGSGVLHVTATAASCDEGSGEGASCHLHQQDWGIPVQVAPDAPGVLVLVLGGPEAQDE